MKWTLYHRYLKNNAFTKFILLFSVIAIATIIMCSYLVFKLISQSAVERQLEVQKRAVESANNYMEQKYESVQAIVRNIYRDDGLAANTAYLLEHPYQDYIGYRMDRFFNESKSASEAVKYFRNQMEDDPDIISLVLYSANEQVMYVYHKNGQFRIIPASAAHSYVPDAMYLGEGGQVSLPNIWVRKSIGLPQSPMFTVRTPINNKFSLRNAGQLLVFFDSGAVWNSIANYKDDYKGAIMVLSANGDVMFDTSGERYGQTYAPSERDGMMITPRTHSQGGFTVVSIVPGAELAATYRGARNAIIMVSVACILFAVLFPSLFLSSFAKRTHNIIRFTRKVKNGDFTARIAVSKEDELGQISRSFNDMLEELNSYIDRVYKAEIKQKHTEIAALEARVNPHFLYNTLEVIRMRAISQGAADVGEMIYSLSALFKSYARPKPVYTLKDELEACRLYLELFRIRYRDKFSYKLHCGKELEKRKMLKMSLQPIVENYILHGMNPERTDNRIQITVTKEGGHIRILVEDNGRGISPERMERLAQELENPEGMTSFGLRSIHERLRLLYGSPHGIEVQSELGEGTVVSVLFPDPGEEAPDYV